MKQLNVPQSGSQANTTASRNRFGQYLRSRRAPVNVNSPAQRGARSNLAAASKNWGGLSDAERAAWSAYAAQHPVKDSLGQSNTLSGFQSFVGVNGITRLVFNATQSVPPVMPAPQIIEAEVVSGPPDGLVIEIGTIIPDPGAALIVRCSPPMSPGRTFNSDYRVLGVMDGVTAGDTFTLGDALAAKFGGLPVGQKIFLMLTPVGSDGAVGADYPLTYTNS